MPEPVCAGGRVASTVFHLLVLSTYSATSVVARHCDTIEPDGSSCARLLPLCRWWTCLRCRKAARACLWRRWTRCSRQRCLTCSSRLAGERPPPPPPLGFVHCASAGRACPSHAARVVALPCTPAGATGCHAMPCHALPCNIALSPPRLDTCTPACCPPPLPAQARDGGGLVPLPPGLWLLAVRGGREHAAVVRGAQPACGGG